MLGCGASASCEKNAGGQRLSCIVCIKSKSCLTFGQVPCEHFHWRLAGLYGKHGNGFLTPFVQGNAFRCSASQFKFKGLMYTAVKKWMSRVEVSDVFCAEACLPEAA